MEPAEAALEAQAGATVGGAVAQSRPGRAVPAWWMRASERLNPIVIKEVRQGLRTKSFWIFFGLMLLACLVISLVAFALTQAGGSVAEGPVYFYAFFFVLSVVSFFIIPYTAFRSLAREREDETWVLLTLTGLGTRRILRGKIASALLQALLYASAAGPFLLFSYFLNGIDLPSILVTLGLGFAYVVFLTAIAVSAATAGQSRSMRAVAHLGTLGFLLFMTGAGLGVGGAVSTEMRRFSFDRDFLLVVGCALWAMASYGVLLFEAAAARLSLATEDYAKGPRVVAIAQVVVTMGIFAAIWLHSGRIKEPGPVMAVVLSVHLGLVGLFLTGDADGQARCHRAQTRWFSLLRPGALRAYRLVLLLLGGTMWVSALMTRVSTGFGSAEQGIQQVVFAAPAYALLYLSAPLVLARATRSRALRSPVGTRLTTLVVVVVGCGLPPLLALLLGADGDDATINLFNPLISLPRLMANRSTPLTDWGLSLVWGFAIAAAIAADRVLAARDKEA